MSIASFPSGVRPRTARYRTTGERREVGARRHCDRSKAIQGHALQPLDCFVARRITRWASRRACPAREISPPLCRDHSGEDIT